MKKYRTVFSAAAVFIVLLAGLYMVLWDPLSETSRNKKDFNRKIMEADAVSAISLNEFTSFEWDKVYTFAPYTPKETIAEIMGFNSDDITQVHNESGMVQLLFIKGNKIVCSICAYSEQLGYDFDFGSYQRYLALNGNDNPMFNIIRSSGITRFIYIQ